jgi:hypothetical protein
LGFSTSPPPLLGLLEKKERAEETETREVECEIQV